MPKRRSLNDSEWVEIAHDLDQVVRDKREGWRAAASVGYTKGMTDEIAYFA